MKYWMVCGLALVFTVVRAAEGESGIGAFVAEARRQEAEAFARQGVSGVARKGRLLRLKAGGKAMRFVDRIDPEREAELLLYRWLGLRLQGRFHEIQVTAYEDEAWYWIDRHSGKTTVFTNAPQISPDARHLAVASDDELNEDKGLWLWAVEARTLRRLFANTDSYFTVLRWDSGSQLQVREWRYEEGGRCPQGIERHRQLARDASARWGLDTPAPPWRCMQAP